jgi:hypothetical protein
MTDSHQVEARIYTRGRRILIVRREAVTTTDAVITIGLFVVHPVNGGESRQLVSSALTLAPGDGEPLLAALIAAGFGHPSGA